jgi:hypothetical protein
VALKHSSRSRTLALKDIYVLGMDRDTGELTMIEKAPVPGAENTSLVSLPMLAALLKEMPW